MPHTAVLPIELYPPVYYINIKPGEKFEFSFLIHEIIVLPIKLSWLLFLRCFMLERFEHSIVNTKNLWLTY